MGRFRILSCLLASSAAAGVAAPAVMAQDTQPVAATEESEIIVTARKSSERLLDVPLPVTALSADDLVSNNQNRLQDYFDQVPGLSLTNSNYGPPIVVVRGISSGGLGNNPTVGIVVDDIPLGASSRDAFGPEAPDLDPSDLARVEVLRGPQGTLYGASSIGGLIKYVTADPSTERLSGRIQAGITGVENGDGLGYLLRGSVNVPVGDTVAVRASAFGRRDAGYIDDPIRNREGVNWGETTGGRLAAIWRPSANTSLRLSALLQDSNTRGSGEIDAIAGLGDLEQSRIPGTGRFRRHFELYSGIFETRLGGATLTSVTGYGHTTKTTALDGSIVFAAPRQFRNDVETDKFTQELRLAGNLGESIDWLLGAYYNDEDSLLVQELSARDPLTGAQTAGVYVNRVPQTFREYAGFANVTVRLGERFDVQFGGRQSWTRQGLSFARTNAGQPQAPQPPADVSKADSFTFLVSPRFRITPDVMIYGRVASGYRPGGPNQDCVARGYPCTYAPDTTVNYEVGIKGSLLDNRLTFDASLYRIDWEDIQVLVLNTAVSTFAFSTNGGSARSQGVELALTARPWRGAAFAGWIAYNDAELTENFPAGTTILGRRGDRLPFSSRFSANLSFDQEIEIAPDVTLSFGGSMSRVGERLSNFIATPNRQVLPGYTQFDLRAGLGVAEWSANLFVNNVGDRRGILYGGVGSLNPTSFSVIQPRTIGFVVSRTF